MRDVNAFRLLLAGFIFKAALIPNVLPSSSADVCSGSGSQRDNPVMKRFLSRGNALWRRPDFEYLRGEASNTVCSDGRKEGGGSGDTAETAFKEYPSIHAPGVGPDTPATDG